MARRGGGGSAVGTIVLVMFLVFFILLSIGLGVTTYLGFAQDDSKANENKKLETEKKELTNQMQWYRFQALLYRVYVDPTQNLDDKTAPALESGRSGYESGTLGAKEPDRDAVKAFITMMDTKLGWDSTKKRPKKTYEELLTAEKKRADDAVAQSELHKKQKDNES